LYGKHGPDAWLRLHKRRFLQPHALHPVLCFESSTERVTSTMTNDPNSNDATQPQGIPQHGKQDESKTDTVHGNGQNGKTAPIGDETLSDHEQEIKQQGYLQGAEDALKLDMSKRTEAQIESYVSELALTYAKKCLTKAEGKALLAKNVMDIYKKGYQEGYSEQSPHYRQEGSVLPPELGPIYEKARKDKEKDGDIPGKEVLFWQAFYAVLTDENLHDHVDTIAKYVHHYLGAYESHKPQPTPLVQTFQHQPTS